MSIFKTHPTWMFRRSSKQMQKFVAQRLSRPELQAIELPE